MKQIEPQTQNKSKQNNQKKNVLQKNNLIELLEEKNSVLFKQVERITKIVQEYDKKVSQKPNTNVKSVLLTTTNDPDILSKELKNCYKQIKIYEFEVDKLKSRTLSIEVSDKMMTIDRQLKQKKQIQDRLKQELNVLTKQISDNSKKLSGNNHQIQREKQYKSKSDQLRFLKQMIKDYETKESIKQKNLKQQYLHIKSLQKQYMQNGGSVNVLQTVKRKALSQFEEGRLVKRQTQNQNQNMKNSIMKNQSTFNHSSLNNINNLSPLDEIDNNRFRSNYENMLNQINVLEKLNKKYQKKFEQSDKIISDIQGKSQLKKLRLQKLEKQIQEMNGSIKLKKTCIVAENMKPGHRKLSVRSVNIKQDVANISQARGINKRKRNIINMTSIMSDRQQRLYNN